MNGYNTDLENLLSFDNFVQDSDMSVFDRIKRDLYIFLNSKVGSTLYGRSLGSIIAEMENEVNYDLLDVLIKTQIVEAVAAYNIGVPPQMQAVCGFGMVDIQRDGNNVDILILYIPLAHIAAENVQQITLNLGAIA